MRRYLLICFAFIALAVQGANVAPAIYSTTSYQVVLPSSVTLAALVTDDGLPSGVLTQLWAKVSGPGTVTFSNVTSTICDASFSQAGAYTLSLTAGDGSLTTTTNTTVTVYASPPNLHVMVSGTGGGTVNGYSSNFTAAYSTTTSITLTSSPSAGSAFIGWVGPDYVGTANPITLSVDSTKNITAFFDLNAVATNLFYVATNGSDSNSGRVGSPWLTIGKAATTVTNGSRVIVGQGIYAENVTPSVSGTPSLPIIFEGTRDTNGAWLTVIDPSTTLSSGWVDASDFATNTWKYTGLTHEPKEVQVNHQRIINCFTNGALNFDGSSSVQLMYSNINQGTWFTYASNLFNMPTNALVVGYNNTLRFWDGIEAISCTSGGSTPYTIWNRFRNGDDPNGKTITVSPNYDGIATWPGNGSTSFQYPSINAAAITSSNLVFRNFLVRGAYGGIVLARNAGHNVAENNYVSGGEGKILVTGGSGGNVIRNNELVSNYYGYHDCGAWNDNVGYRYAIRKILYGDCKYIMGHSDTADESVQLIGVGDTNLVYGNHIYNGFGGDGMIIWNTSAPAARDTRIFDNTIENQGSTAALFNPWQTNLWFYNNIIRDNNAQLRPALLGQSGDSRSLFIFRNQMWLPDVAGEHFFFFGASSTPSAMPPLWIYHNSISGGVNAFVWNDTFPANGGMTNGHIINNIASDTAPFYFNTSSMGTSANNLGDFAYNMLKTATHPAWYGAGNIDQSTNEWASTPAMSFALVTGSPAIGAAIDTSSSFTLQSISYPALPDTAVKIGLAWDMGALEFVPPPPVATGVLDVGLGVLWKQ